MNISELGWNKFFEDNFAEYKAQELIPARVSEEHRNNYRLLSEHGELFAEISGKYRFAVETRGQLPTVGDWVAITHLPSESKGIIQALLPRKSVFERKVAGETTVEQVVAANVDIIFIVCGLDNNYNIRRIERYLTLGWESGAMPVIVLNKADLCDNIDERLAEAAAVSIGVPLHITSARDGSGFEIFQQYLEPGKTGAFLGSSGVGKSSIINCLTGSNDLPTQEVRDYDSRGRHTTTYRQLIMLPSGGIVIDTPGMRLLKLWGDDSGIKRVFEEIEELSTGCRFRDCSHNEEPGCAVQAAIANGSLPQDRFDSYVKLLKEQRYLESRQSMKASAVEKLRWKMIARFQKDLKKRAGNKHG
jgi:ribosome biogenesis GTPase / thiamine phosphate phosphatase